MITVRRVALIAVASVLVIGMTSYLMVCGFVESVE